MMRGRKSANKSIVVIDDFYDDPDAVRKLALSLKYKSKARAGYPGKEAIAPDKNWSLVRKRLRSHIDEPCDAPCPKFPPFPQGKFRLALASDAARRLDRVHLDLQRWSAVIYLTKAEHCRDGLALYRHRPTGSVEWPDDWFLAHYGHFNLLPFAERQLKMFEFFRDPKQFEQIGLIPMAYNRAIILMSHVFHGTGAVFGKNRYNGRLSQHFEFYAEE